jgi:hypothetical protein
MEALVAAREKKFRDDDERTKRDQQRYADEKDADLAARCVEPWRPRCLTIVILGFGTARQKMVLE